MALRTQSNRLRHLVVVAKVAELHVFFHVVVIEVLLHPPDVAPVQIPVAFPAMPHASGQLIHGLCTLQLTDQKSCTKVTP